MRWPCKFIESLFRYIFSVVLSQSEASAILKGHFIAAELQPLLDMQQDFFWISGSWGNTIMPVAAFCRRQRLRYEMRSILDTQQHIRPASPLVTTLHNGQPAGRAASLRERQAYDSSRNSTCHQPHRRVDTEKTCRPLVDKTNAFLASLARSRHVSFRASGHFQRFALGTLVQISHHRGTQQFI
jgi:hypothetical protein